MNVQKKNILIVEDDPFHLELIKRSISRDSNQNHYDLVNTKSKALQALKNKTYHLVLSDLFLPDGDGIELIREQPGIEKVPVVIMTALGNDQVGMSIIEEGALDFVVKSSSLLLDLPSAVEQLLNKTSLSKDETKFQTLFENERKLLTIFIDNIPDDIYFKDTKSRFIRINKVKAERHGLKNPVLAIGKTDFNYFSKEHAQQAFDDEKKIMETGQTLRIEEKETWPDGSITWVSSIKMPHYNSEGKIAGTFGISKDITEKKLAEATIQKEKDFINAILNTANALIVVTRNTGEVVRYNKAFEKATGYSCKQLKSIKIWDTILKQEDKDTFHQLLKEVSKGKSVNKNRLGMLCNHGKEKVIEWSHSQLKDPASNTSFIVSVGINITKQIKAEEAVRQYVDIFKHADMGMLIFCRDLSDINLKPKLVDMNPAFQKLTGLEAQNCLGKDVNEILPGFCQEKTCQRCIQLFLNGESYEMGEFKFEDMNGKTKWFFIRVFPLPNNHIGVTLDDITERKKMQHHSLQSLKLESIGQLAAGIAHEINTPAQYVGDNTLFLDQSFKDISDILGSVKQVLENSRENKLNPETVQQLNQKVSDCDLDFLIQEIPVAIQQSLEGIHRISNIVSAMRDFSHPASEEKTSTDINRAVETTVTIARNEWKYVADVKMDLDENMPLVSCYPDELNQVILNIIINASHAIAERIGDSENQKGLIHIETYYEKGWAEIRISDTGKGIPEAYHNKIFNPFFTTKDVGKGTGQGLAISHDVIVNKHEGKLFFETELNKGTTFIIQLPND